MGRTSSFPRSKSLSSSTPRYENVRNVLFFLSSAARAGSVTPESAYVRSSAFSTSPSRILAPSIENNSEDCQHSPSCVCRVRVLRRGRYGKPCTAESQTGGGCRSVGAQLYSSQPPPAVHPESRASGVAHTNIVG